MHNHADSKGQPAPTGNGQSVTVELVHDLLDRREVGIAKYGQELKTGNGRRALVDAYQEVLDLAMYLKQALMEEDAKIENSVGPMLFSLGELELMRSHIGRINLDIFPEAHAVYTKLTSYIIQLRAAGQ